MPNTPGLVLFPANLDDADSLIRASNSAATTLSTAVTPTTPASGGTITVASTSSFPATGAFSIDAEIFFYTGKTATTFTGCSRASDGSVAAAHVVGAAVQMRIVAAHHTVLSGAAVALETKVGSSASVPANGTVLGGTGAGTSAWTGSPYIATRMGLGVTPSTNILLNASGTITDSNTQRASLWLSGDIATANNGTYYGIIANPQLTASSTAVAQANLMGLSSNPVVGSAAQANLTNAFGLYIRFTQNSSTSVTANAYGIYILNPGGTGTINNSVGIYIANQTRGATNTAFYSEGGLMYHGGPLVVGNVATALATKTAAYTLTSTDSVVLAGGGGTFSLTLPTAVGITGRQYTVKKLDAGGTVTLATTSSQTIDGAANKTLTAQWDKLTVVSDGANWLTI